MARTRQTARRPATHRHVLETFADHAGQTAVRYQEIAINPIRDHRSIDNDSEERVSDASSDAEPPLLFFQLYSSVELDFLSDDRDDFPERTLEEFLCKLMDPDVGSKQRPAWEIYTLAGASVLDFVDHSRREIASRHRQHACGNLTNPLIQSVVYSHLTDHRTSAFLIGIDSIEGYQQGNASHDYTNREGCLWVHFDSRLPNEVTKVDDTWRMRDDPNDEFQQFEDEPISYWPDQIEMQVRRQDFEEQTHDLLAIYLTTVSTHRKHGNYHAGGSIEAEPVLSVEFATENLVQLVSQIQLDDMPYALELVDDSHVSTHTCESDTIPGVRYIVYVPFAHGDSNLLQAAAHRFTRLYTDLDNRNTVDFDFYSPGTTDATLLAHFRGLQLASDAVGLWTNMQAMFSWADFENKRPKVGAYRRLRPIELNPRIHDNDPDTGQYTAYPEFLVILDRPDFESVSCVRFLLAGGSRVREDKAIIKDIIRVMDSWRAVDMKGIVDRLAFRLADQGDNPRCYYE